MEENKTTAENNKPSYEQLEQMILHLQQRLMQSESRLGAINLTAMRLNYLFSILDRSAHFPEKFVEDITEEIIELLEVEKPETKESNIIEFPKK